MHWNRTHTTMEAGAHAQLEASDRGLISVVEGAGSG